MNIRQIADYLNNCPPGPERFALMDLLDALLSSSHALFTVNLATNTKLHKGDVNEAAGTPDLFQV